MADYFAFQSENLFLSKLIVIGIIHAILSFVVLEGALRQSRRYVFFIPARFVARLLPSPYHRGGGGIVIGTAVAALSSVGATGIAGLTKRLLSA